MLVKNNITTMKITLFALFITVCGCLLAQTPQTEAAPPAKPVVAVAPFDNRTGGVTSGETSQVVENYTEHRHAKETQHVHSTDYDKREHDIAARGRVSGESTSWHGTPRWGGSDRKSREAELEHKHKHEHAHRDDQDYTQERGYDQTRQLNVIPSTSSSCQLPEIAADVATDAVNEALASSGRVRVVSCGGGDWGELGGGVDYVLKGSINSYNVKNDVSMVYGVRRWKNTVTVGLNMKLIKVSNREVVASKMLSEKVTRNIPQGVILKDGLNDDWEELLRTAIGSAVPKFIDAVEIDSYVPTAASSSTTASSSATMVSFEVSSRPLGADVEYNHSYVGNTPCTVKAPAVPGILRITLDGYEPWEKRVIPDADMNISPQLKKSSGGTPDREAADQE